MGISIDGKKLEKLYQLESVLSLLQDAAASKKLLEEVKGVLALQEKVVARYTTVELADRYMQDAQDALTAAEVKVKQITAELEEKQKRGEAELEQQRLRAQEEQREREAKLETARKELETAREDLRVKQVEQDRLAQELKKHAENLDLREKRVRVAEDAQKTLAAQIAQMNKL